MFSFIKLRKNKFYKKIGLLQNIHPNIWWIGVFLLLIIGSLSSGYINTFLLFFSNVFIFGLSDAKLLSFLAYGLVFYILDFLLDQYLYKDRFFDKKLLSKLRAWSIFFIIVLAILNLDSYFSFLSRHDLKIRDFPIMSYRGSYDTAGHLIHTHTFKPAITIPLTFFGIHDISGYGTGLSFFDDSRKIYYFASFLLSIVMIVTVVFYGLVLSNKEKLTNVKKLFFILISFGMIKALYDGGPLWHEFILLFFLFVFAFFQKNNSVFEKHIYINIVSYFFYLLFILCVFYYFYYFYINFGLSLMRLFHIFSPVVSLACLVLGSYLFLYMNSKRKLFIAFLLVIGLILQLDGPYFKTIQYSFNKVEPNDSVIIKTNKKLSLPIFRHEGKVNVYKYESKKTERFLDIVVRNNLRLSYYPIDIEGKSCVANEDRESITFRVRLLEGDINKNYFNDKFESTEESFFSEINIVSYADFTNANQFYINLKTKGCYPGLQLIVTNHLYQQGFTKFILTRI